MPLLGASPVAVVPRLPGRPVTAAPDATVGLQPLLPPGAAPYVFVNNQVGGSGTSRTFTVPANQPPTQQGDTLLITLNIASAAMTISAVTDNAGNTYTLDSAGTTTAPQHRNYRCANASPVAPGTVITVTTSATNATLCLGGICIPGGAWEAVPDVISTVTHFASQTSQSLSITPTGDNELILIIGTNQSIGGPNYVQPPFYGWWINTSVAGTNEITWAYLPCGAGTAGVAQTATISFGQQNNGNICGFAFVPNQIALADAAAAVDAIVAGPGFTVATGLTTGSGTSRTATVSAPTQAGDTLLALVTTQATACTISSLTDARGNVYTLDRSNTSALPLAYYFRSPGATGGPGGTPTVALQSGDIVTATSAAQTGNVEILLADIGAVGAVDQISAVATGSGGTASASVTPTANGEICVGLLASSNTGGQPVVAAPYAPIGSYHTGVNIYNTIASQALAAGTGSGVAQTFSATITPIAWNAVQYSFLPPSAAKMATLTDAFPGSAVDTTKWTAFPSAGGSVSVSGNVLSLTDTASTAAFSVLQSNASYDLTGSYLLASLASAGTQATNTLALMKVQADASNSVQILVQNGTLAAQHQVAGSFSALLGSVTYSATAHKWLRIREAGGTLFYEFSADGINWSTLYSEANPITLTALTASLQEGSTGTTDPAATSQWASVNLPPTPVALPDAAAAAEALSVSATVGLPDTGAAAEALAVQASVPVADAAGAAEQISASVAAPLAERGAAVDAITAAVTTAAAEAAGAADQVAVQAAVPLAEAAGAVDALTIPAKGIPLAEAGGAADSISVSETTSLPDAAGAVDSLAVTVAVPLPDAGAAAEGLSATVTVPLADAAGAADAVGVSGSSNPALAEAGGAADVLSATVTAPLADPGAAAEQLAVQAAVPLADAAGAADTLAIPAKTLPVADAAGAVDSISVQETTSLADSGAAAEQLTAAVQAPLADAGGAADSITAAVTSPIADVAAAADTLTVQQGSFIGVADAAGAADSLTVAVSVPLADQAAAVDSAAVSAAVPLTDAGAARDVSGAAVQVPLADAAGAAEAITAAVPVALADAGAAGDALAVAAAVPLPDAGAAAEQLAVTGSNAPQLADAAGAADSLSVQETTSLADAAGAADSLAVTVAVPLADIGAAADAEGVSAQVPLADAAGAADGLTTLGTASPVLGDAGAATDALSAAVSTAGHDVAAASDSLAVIVGISVSVSDSAGAVDSLRVTMPSIGPQAVWRCGSAAQRWICAVATARWLVAAAAARWETEPSLPRWAVRMLAARWEAIMAEFKPVASISQANVNVTWTSDLAGTEEDPTTAPFPVRFAFPVSSGDENAPAQPVTWFDGAWMDPQGRQQGWIAQCPIGPLADGGLVQLARGRYDVWSEVDAGGETPREFVGVLPVY